MNPRALDLFCGAGGATKGLQLAGFHVTGVDIKPQPRYCGDAFVQADALAPPFDLASFDFIWASPPCQAFSAANPLTNHKHPNLIPQTRALLAGSGAVTCIENVPGAPLRADLVLDGTMFPGLRVIRRRHFELSFPAPLLLGFPSAGLVGMHGWACPTGGDNSSHVRASRKRWGLPIRDSNEKRAECMGIDWTTKRQEVANAIPPAYSEFIGRAALAHTAPSTVKRKQNRAAA